MNASRITMLPPSQKIAMASFGWRPMVDWIRWSQLTRYTTSIFAMTNQMTKVSWMMRYARSFVTNMETFGSAHPWAFQNFRNVTMEKFSSSIIASTHANLKGKAGSIVSMKTNTETCSSERKKTALKCSTRKRASLVRLSLIFSPDVPLKAFALSSEMEIMSSGWEQLTDYTFIMIWKSLLSPCEIIPKTILHSTITRSDPFTSTQQKLIG